MTFEDLQKLVESESGSSKAAESNRILQRLRGKQFWDWGIKEHKRRDIASKGNCCFNHIIGLPKKDNKEFPLFDYEMMLLNALLEPGYFNSNPKLLTHDPGNVMHTFKEKHLVKRVQASVAANSSLG